MCGHSKKVAICKPERELSSGSKSAGTVILDFLAFKLVGYKFLLFKPPSLWYFVMAAEQTSTDFGAERWGAAVTNT